MYDALELSRDWPLRRLLAGEALITEHVRTDQLYVLREGGFQIIRDGVTFVRTQEPGAFLGEMAILLGSAPTGSVIATMDSVVHVLENASTVVLSNPVLLAALGRTLALRLNAVTAYLADIKRQYGETNSHLALMDQVLADLAMTHPGIVTTGSERDDVPDY